MTQQLLPPPLAVPSIMMATADDSTGSQPPAQPATKHEPPPAAPTRSHVVPIIVIAAVCCLAVGVAVPVVMALNVFHGYSGGTPVVTPMPEMSSTQPVDGSGTVAQAAGTNQNTSSGALATSDTSDASGTPAQPVTPPIVPPTLPSADTPFPSSDDQPTVTQVPGVTPWTSLDVPLTTDQIFETMPSDTTGDDAAALQSLQTWVSSINSQDLNAAWTINTYATTGSPTATWLKGYSTARYYQVDLGEPNQVASDLIVIPASYVYRRDNGAGDTSLPACTYWPQYVFVMAKVDGVWRKDDTRFGSRKELAPFKRVSPQTGHMVLDPSASYVTCS